MVRAIFAVLAGWVIFAAAVLYFTADVPNASNASTQAAAAAGVWWEVEQEFDSHRDQLKEELVWALVGPEVWARSRPGNDLPNIREAREEVLSFYDKTAGWLASSAEGASAPALEGNFQEAAHRLRQLMKSAAGGSPHAPGSSREIDARLAILRPMVAGLIDDAWWASLNRACRISRQMADLTKARSASDSVATRKSVIRLPEVD